MVPSLEPTEWALAMMRLHMPEVSGLGAGLNLPPRMLKHALLLDQVRDYGVRLGLETAQKFLEVPPDVPREGNVIARDRDLSIRCLSYIDPTALLANHDRKKT